MSLDAPSLSACRTELTARIDLSSKFSCVFGISDQIETLPPGEAHFTFNQGHNFTLFTGKDGIVYWFLFEDMGKSYEQGALPRFAASDAEASCQQYLESSITPTVKFGDVYSRRKVKTKVPFEEGVASHWHSGRVVIVGDSAHKVGPSPSPSCDRVPTSTFSDDHKLSNGRKHGH